MSYRIQVTDTAKQDLREIAIWIAEQAKSIETAKRFINELKAEITKLDAFPNAGANPKDHILMSAGFKYIVHKDYLIFYTVDEKEQTVTVLAVFNAKKDYMRVMRRYI